MPDCFARAKLQGEERREVTNTTKQISQQVFKIVFIFLGHEARMSYHTDAFEDFRQQLHSFDENKSNLLSS